MQQINREEFVDAYERLRDGLDAIVLDLIDARQRIPLVESKLYVDRALKRARSLTVLLRSMAF